MATARKPAAKKPAPAAEAPIQPAKPTAKKPAKPAAKKPGRPAKKAKPAAVVPTPAPTPVQAELLSGLPDNEPHSAASTEKPASKHHPIVVREKRIRVDELVHDEVVPAKRGRGRPPIVVPTGDWHERMVDALGDWQHMAMTMMDRMNALLDERYPKKAPTYEEYMADQKAFAQLAEKRGLASNQWLRKPYAAAIKIRFNALPIQMTPEAIRKRKAREAEKALKLSMKTAAEQQASKQAQLTLVAPAEPANEPGVATEAPALRDQLAALLDGYSVAGVLEGLSGLLQMGDDPEVRAIGKAIHELAGDLDPALVTEDKPATPAGWVEAEVEDAALGEVGAADAALDGLEVLEVAQASGTENDRWIFPTSGDHPDAQAA